jgi:ABC-type glutathione transport system ATPase component
VQARVLDLLEGLRRRRGLAILLITHDLALAAARADVVAVMYGGRIVECAAAPEVLRRPRHPYTAALLACTPALDRPRARLATVAEVLRDGALAAPVAPGLLAWWPRGAAPPDLAPDEHGRREALVEVAPGHWVACWRRAAVQDLTPAAPIPGSRSRPRASS